MVNLDSPRDILIKAVCLIIFGKQNGYFENQELLLYVKVTNVCPKNISTVNLSTVQIVPYQ